MSFVTGKRCVVTGANSGIGRAMASALAKDDAEVVMVCRNRAKGEEALSEIRAETPGARVELALCDVGDMESVRAFCEGFKKRADKKIDVLFNNAGVYLPERALSPQGYESMLAINHLGPLLMTSLLLDELEGGRVITTSSFAHTWGGIDLTDLDYARGVWVPMRQYGTTKLCNVLFTRELHKRFADRGIFAACFHPGAVGTGFAQDETGFLAFGMKLVKPVLRTPEQGADTGLFIARLDDPSPFAGRYLSSRKARTLFGQASDDALAEALWVESERRVGLG